MSTGTIYVRKAGRIKEEERRKARERVRSQRGGEAGWLRVEKSDLSVMHVLSP